MPYCLDCETKPPIKFSFSFTPIASKAFLASGKSSAEIGASLILASFRANWFTPLSIALVAQEEGLAFNSTGLSSLTFKPTSRTAWFGFSLIVFSFSLYKLSYTPKTFSSVTASLVLLFFILAFCSLINANCSLVDLRPKP